mmetsp:Transcript_3819/g.12381  ORF Transcript_3819/g.12381 Transcript_3819/m.12381 type:complete len:191 (+) Transcript_3819:63-635(+)|eukprot:CAMPEP_0204566024 /NCGR_PEP_ID=MMETSP0661-20131031/35818_1 /ASSEMBLY_ACC=CAM_ASM_000606 /TAXON_ID=109239 /ORGANISM="Alexandrium margalefi, Strain AMGDE01CS-322" /LENGTH=190 /DNA_ID=CAMNT_0051573835 /DNA_START=63 /DNA_END=635 /DNA_ORIENTATION=-
MTMYSPMPGDTVLPIPTGLHVVLWCELIIFLPFSLSHYFGPFHAEWRQLSHLKAGRVKLMAGEMLNGVGALVLMLMIFEALCSSTITRVELDVLFVSHALWIGVCIAVKPPLFFHCINPHSWLSVALWITSAHLARWPILLACVLIMLFGFYRMRVQVPANFGEADDVPPHLSSASFGETQPLQASDSKV